MQNHHFSALGAMSRKSGSQNLVFSRSVTKTANAQVTHLKVVLFLGWGWGLIRFLMPKFEYMVETFLNSIKNVNRPGWPKLVITNVFSGETGGPSFTDYWSVQSWGRVRREESILCTPLRLTFDQLLNRK